jgi:transcriptional regulator with XRE-family HTH domain
LTLIWFGAYGRRGMNKRNTAKKEYLSERNCYDCGKKMHGRRENYTYGECGLRSVILLNILVFHCECGAIVPEIPSPSILHVSIAMNVLKKKTLLSGEEVRFLRKVAGYSATDLSKVIGMKNTSVSHWETSSKPIGKDADRLVRLSCFARIIYNISDSDVGLMENVNRLAQVTKELNLTSVLEHIEDRFAGSQSVKINPDVLAGLDIASPHGSLAVVQ